ncbi:aspartate aminotransferase [Microcystis aeruginosa KW]|uniref:Aspartate aminotransferase n=1 Tax=Microcystis aeruginosa KW TaxID=1960155 RepID=A0A1V4BT11_MICAE|nr:pyridoxal phosphate-dependent aminotransferase [Microcystis aeruginosa]OPF17568.1 aspartate aminotransferase [Microcystis aeruginosa KW]
MKDLLSRMDGVQTPIIPVVGQLIKANPGTISLGQGVVSYDPPREAIESLSLFLANPKNHQYQSVAGIPPLLAVIRQKLAEDNRIEISDKQAIFVTAGSNMAFMNAVLAITSPGDEIILNTPFYFNHEMAIKMADCQVILVATDKNYQLRPAAIEEAITEKTKAVVTISPNNPTGVVYPENTLREVNRICQKKGIYHIHDEAYEYFTYNHARHFSPAAIVDSESWTISLFSLSKAYGFASWRIGYMVVPEHLSEAINKIQDTILICPPVVSQYAALGALQVGKSYPLEQLKTISQVREICLNALESIGDICDVATAEGAFYFFLKIPTDKNDFQLVKSLIEQQRVAVLPGSTFGITEGCYLRLAYGALSPETALTAVERLVKGLRYFSQ